MSVRAGRCAGKNGQVVRGGNGYFYVRIDDSCDGLVPVRGTDLICQEEVEQKKRKENPSLVTRTTVIHPRKQPRLYDVHPENKEIKDEETEEETAASILLYMKHTLPLLSASAASFSSSVSSSPRPRVTKQ